jgi:muramidase (phage lysozyme)
MRAPLLLAVGLAAAGIFAATRARAAVTSPGAGAAGASQWLERALGSLGGDDVTNESAFLRMLRDAEHQGLPYSDAERYYRIFGGGRVESLHDHPRQRRAFTQTNGHVNYTTAALAYQFLESTWDRLVAKLGLVDASPENQDRAALELIREAGALGDVRAGRFEDAVGKVNRIWASLPGSPYPQKTRSLAFVRESYELAGGTYA